MTCACFLVVAQTMPLTGEKKEQKSQHCMISVSLSFLITAKDFLWTLFYWLPYITRYSHFSPKAAKSPRWKGSPETLWSSLCPMCICRLSTLTDGRPGCTPTVLCLWRRSLLLVMSPSLRNNVFHLIVVETACSPFCCRDACGQCIPGPCGLGFQIHGRQQQGLEMSFSSLEPFLALFLLTESKVLTIK